MKRQALAVLATQSEDCAQFFAPLVYKSPELITESFQTIKRFWRFHEESIRTLSSLKMRGKSAERKIQWCAKHLFERYQTPGCLRHAFTDDFEIEARWYVALAKGRSAREVLKPYALTKRQAHAFTVQAWDPSLRGEAIVRFIQARDYGAKDNANTRALAVAFADAFSSKTCTESQIQKALEVIVRHKTKAKDIHSLVHWCALRMEDNAQFKLTSKNIARERLLARESAVAVKLKPKSFAELTRFTGYEGRFQVLHYFVELRTANALRIEGHAMSHCVGEYFDEVSAGESYIFSLRSVLYRGEIERSAQASGMRRHFTVEVDIDSQCVLQAYGKANRSLYENEKTMLRSFCHRNGFALTL